MAWFRRPQAPLPKQPAAESRVPEGMWVKCSSCKEILYRKDVLKNLSVCPKCSFHFRLSARERLEMLFDGPFEELDRGLVSADPLGFRDSKPYAERLSAGKAKTDCYDAVISAIGDMGGRRTVVAAMEYAFIGATWMRASLRWPWAWPPLSCRPPRPAQASCRRRGSPSALP